MQTPLFIPSYNRFSYRAGHCHQADAADDNAMSDVCYRALREEDRLDVVLANIVVDAIILI